MSPAGRGASDGQSSDARGVTAVGFDRDRAAALSLWRAGRTWPWPVIATVAVPFLLFAVYWGASSTGMMREGLQAWALTLFAVVAAQQTSAGFTWLRSKSLRALLTLRAVELLAIAVAPALATGHALISGAFALTDTAALGATVAFSMFLGAMVWSNASRLLDGEL